MARLGQGPRLSAVAAMNAVYKLITGRELNTATLSGAIDIVVIRHPDGMLVSTPFHVRFGKLMILHAKEKLVRRSGRAGERAHVHELTHLSLGVRSRSRSTTSQSISP